MLDISVAMTFAMLSPFGKKRRSISAAAAMLRGFHAVSPLMEVERRHLILLIACRLACSVTLSAYSYQQNPGNKYFLHQSVEGWEALDLIWGTDIQRRKSIGQSMNRLFDQACDCKAEIDKKNEGEKPGSVVFDCRDLVFPDPCHVDILSDIRELNKSDQKVDKPGNERPFKRRRSH